MQKKPGPPVARGFGVDVFKVGKKSGQTVRPLLPQNPKPEQQAKKHHQ